jgi:hypothetical protein
LPLFEVPGAPCVRVAEVQFRKQTLVNELPHTGDVLYGRACLIYPRYRKVGAHNVISRLGNCGALVYSWSPWLSWLKRWSHNIERTLFADPRYPKVGSSTLPGDTFAPPAMQLLDWNLSTSFVLPTKGMLVPNR